MVLVSFFEEVLSFLISSIENARKIQTKEGLGWELTERKSYGLRLVLLISMNWCDKCPVFVVTIDFLIEIKILHSVSEIPNFLSEEECDHIISLASENELFKSVAKGGLTHSDTWKYDPKCEFCKVKPIT